MSRKTKFVYGGRRYKRILNIRKMVDLSGVLTHEVAYKVKEILRY